MCIIVATSICKWLTKSLKMKKKQRDTNLCFSLIESPPPKSMLFIQSFLSSSGFAEHSTTTQHSTPASSVKFPSSTISFRSHSWVDENSWLDSFLRRGNGKASAVVVSQLVHSEENEQRKLRNTETRECFEEGQWTNSQPQWKVCAEGEEVRPRATAQYLL